MLSALPEAAVLVDVGDRCTSLLLSVIILIWWYTQLCHRVDESVTYSWHAGQSRNVDGTLRAVQTGEIADTVFLPAEVTKHGVVVPALVSELRPVVVIAP